MGSTKCIWASSILSKNKRVWAKGRQEKEEASNTFVLLAIRTHFLFSVFHVGSIGLSPVH